MRFYESKLVFFVRESRVGFGLLESGNGANALERSERRLLFKFGSSDTALVRAVFVSVAAVADTSSVI